MIYRITAVEAVAAADGMGRAAAGAIARCRNAQEAATLVAKLESTPRAQWAAMLVTDGRYWGSAKERASVEARAMKKELRTLERDVRRSAAVAVAGH